jgi:hypothetical protein
MAETEAKGLLRNGALYLKRIGLRDAHGRMLFVGVKRGAFSLYFDNEPIYHFDLDGRWQRAYIDGNHVRKALDQTVDMISRDRVPEGIAIRRRALAHDEIASLDDAIRDVAIDVSVGLATKRYEVVDPPTSDVALTRDELGDLLDRVATWDASAWFAMKERYLRIYGAGLTFIPPDAQNAIVLDPFDEDGRSRDPDEFVTHCREVSRFLGRRAIQASTAFLKGRDSLRRPIGEILANLDAIAEVFPTRDDPRPLRPRDLPADRPSLSGIDVFFEFWQDGADLPDAAGWLALASRRVRRVTASFGLNEDRSDASPSIAHAKQAGIAISVVLVCESDDPGRVASVAEAVNTLPLGRGDFVHLMGGIGGNSWQDADTSRQFEALTAMLTPTRTRGVKVNVYNPLKQWS